MPTEQTNAELLDSLEVGAKVLSLQKTEHGICAIAVKPKVNWTLRDGYKGSCDDAHLIKADGETVHWTNFCYWPAKASDPRYGIEVISRPDAKAEPATVAPDCKCCLGYKLTGEALLEKACRLQTELNAARQAMREARATLGRAMEMTLATRRAEGVEPLPTND